MTTSFSVTTLRQLGAIDERRNLRLEPLDLDRLVVARRVVRRGLLQLALDRVLTRRDRLDVPGLDLLEEERLVRHPRAVRRRAGEERDQEVEDEQPDEEREQGPAAWKHRRLRLLVPAAVGRRLHSPAAVWCPAHPPALVREPDRAPQCKPTAYPKVNAYARPPEPRRRSRRCARRSSRAGGSAGRGAAAERRRARPRRSPLRRRRPAVGHRA